MSRSEFVLWRDWYRASLKGGALNFEMRVYVAQLRDRMETTSDLHRAIIRVFRERGIEISFPQMEGALRTGSVDAVPLAEPFWTFVRGTG